MNWETWEKYKTNLQNETWTPFFKWPTDVQDAMREIEPEARMFLDPSGKWTPWPSGLQPGMAYRVNPSWPGPSKPEPVAEYDDCEVFLIGYMYRFSIPSISGTRWNLTAAPGAVGFAGYVYAGKDGKPECCPATILDQQTDGTWHLRVPLAVRLRKEVAQ